jgi:hypothetical protein
MSNAVILTSYFSQKIHPNDPNDKGVIGRGGDGRVWQNSFEYIKVWYDSIQNLDLDARIFYDDLSDDFVKKYSTDKIQFIKIQMSVFSNLDWRFFCYRNYLNNHYHDSVFLTDCSDVKIVKNPSDIIKEYPDTNYFVCKDNISTRDFNYIKVHSHFKWDNLEWFVNHHNNNSLDLLNMGVIGAKYEDMLNFLDKFCVVRLKMSNPEFAQADMWVGQYVFRHLLSSKKKLIGNPFTSDFKKYQNDREDVYFIHK